MGFSATESENIFVWSVPARLTPKTISVPVGASPVARSSTLRGDRSSRATLARPIIRTRSNEASDPRPSPGGAFPRAPDLSIASVPRDPRRGGALNGPSTPKADRALTLSGRDVSVDPRDCDNSGARISHLDPTGRSVSRFPLHGNPGLAVKLLPWRARSAQILKPIRRSDRRSRLSGTRDQSRKARKFTEKRFRIDFSSSVSFRVFRG
jgi:hypothetical protein